jgi:hypothetical protein
MAQDRLTTILNRSATPGASGISGCVLVLKSTPLLGGMDGAMRGEVTLIRVLIGYLGDYSR